MFWLGAPAPKVPGSDSKAHLAFRFGVIFRKRGQERLNLRFGRAFCCILCQSFAAVKIARFFPSVFAVGYVRLFLYARRNFHLAPWVFIPVAGDCGAPGLRVFALRVIFFFEFVFFCCRPGPGVFAFACGHLRGGAYITIICDLCVGTKGMFQIKADPLCMKSHGGDNFKGRDSRSQYIFRDLCAVHRPRCLIGVEKAIRLAKF